jgi:uncharacterized damage-inducible protein DinB
MIDQETLAEFASWAAKNIAFNLEFIPEDKLDWKPSADASSVLEIVNHIGSNFSRFLSLFESSDSPPFIPATTAAEGKQMLLDAARRYSQVIRTAGSEQLSRQIKVMGMGIKVKQAASMLVMDTINHHGQVTYIQTLLGDTHSHFDATAFQHIAS